MENIFEAVSRSSLGSPAHVEAAVHPLLTHLCSRGVWRAAGLPAWYYPRGLLRDYILPSVSSVQRSGSIRLPAKLQVCSAQVQGPWFLACRQGTHGFLSQATASSPPCTGLTSPQLGWALDHTALWLQGLCLTTPGNKGPTVPPCSHFLLGRSPKLWGPITPYFSDGKAGRAGQRRSGWLTAERTWLQALGGAHLPV